MSSNIQIGIVGGAGYTGGELLRILINHLNADIRFILSKSHAGQPVSHVHGDLLGETDLIFAEHLAEDIDVLFLCVGHGEAKKIPGRKQDQFEDQDHRPLSGFQIIANNQPSYGNGKSFVYGLPELNREAIRTAQNVANPGCFATAIQLGLLPLAAAGLLGQVHTTGITGSTGAGQSLSGSSHFSWRSNNIQAYKTLNTNTLLKLCNRCVR
jgi:N-acetyl-gamma-glutamyl-phosphate reductase